MLGRMPLVSISDKRLGGTENSSLRYLSATRAPEFSTSRMVRPSFSRSVRRFFPAGSMGTPPKELRNNIKGGFALCHAIVQKVERPPSVTNSEHAPRLVPCAEPSQHLVLRHGI